MSDSIAYCKQQLAEVQVMLLKLQNHEDLREKSEKEMELEKQFYMLVNDNKLSV